MTTADYAGASLRGLQYRLERESEWRPFTREEVRRVPSDQGGVYAIWLPPYDCLYVGMSEDRIGARLMDHLRSEANPGLRSDLTLNSTDVRFSAAYPLALEDIRVLEAALIRDWAPRHNRAFNA